METNFLEGSLAGTWYQANPRSLQDELQGYLDQADVTPRKGIVALISPHAGYTYSGPCAAKGMKLAQGPYARIIVIGPSHRMPLGNRFALPQAAIYRTVLGEIPLDQEGIQKLLKHEAFIAQSHAFRQENSIEMQLPLLQQCFGNFKLLPIAAGQNDWPTIQAAAQAIRACVDDQTLVVASGDLTHYDPNFGYLPFSTDIPVNLKKLDMGAWERIVARDGMGFLAYLDKTGATICGRTSIAVLLAMLEPKMEAHLVDYQTSGQITGDYQNSVSYLSAAFSGAWAPAAEEKTMELTSEEKKSLLTLARKTIAYALEHGREPTHVNLDLTLTTGLEAERAAFVTLHQGPNLRGCIGEIFPSQPLYRSVMRNAVNAALNDPRFPGVTLQELSGLHIEISALTPPSEVARWQDIRVGIDGMVLRKQSHSAVFLPQVAPEQGWDLETTLTYLAQKAGLAQDAWREGATFLTFQAEVFGEHR